MRLGDFTTLTFDCYGTLIDWETGIHEALRPWLARHGAEIGREALLAAFARQESAQQAETPSMLYPELLGRVLTRMGEEFGLPVTAAEAEAFGQSVGEWPAFADSAEALAYLRRHYRLVVLSNVDRAGIARSAAKLGDPFDAVYTAEEIGSYKPDPRNFAFLLERLSEQGCRREEILHTAQSLFHDHVPAKAAGLATCWIDRHAGRAGGATPPVAAPVETDFRFVSLAAMVEAHRAEQQG